MDVTLEQWGTLLLSCAALNLLGKVVVERFTLPRLSCWVFLAILFIAVDQYFAEAPIWSRVVILCVTLLLGMKVITYREWLWTGGSRMRLVRWLGFAFLWFGMEPKAWVGKRRRLEWQSHAMAAVISILLGLTGWLLLDWFNVDVFVLQFICLSMMVHFGVLRGLTAFWRKAGLPVRQLFRNPALTTGFRDFWGARWNLAYSQMMARCVQRPLQQHLGERGSIFSVFVISGLIHECAITVPVGSGYGMPTLFFAVHGAASVLEPTRANAWWLRYACLGLVIFGLPILFPQEFIDGVIVPIKTIFSYG